MKKKIVAVALILVSFFGNAQTKADSIQQVEANAFIDSLVTNTSLKQFQQFLYENVSQKSASEGRFTELYNSFLQTNYAAWLQRKSKPKTK